MTGEGARAWACSTPASARSSMSGTPICQAPIKQKLGCNEHVDSVDSGRCRFDYGDHDLTAPAPSSLDAGLMQGRLPTRAAFVSFVRVRSGQWRLSAKNLNRQNTVIRSSSIWMMRIAKVSDWRSIIAAQRQTGGRRTSGSGGKPTGTRRATDRGLPSRQSVSRTPRKYFLTRKYSRQQSTPNKKYSQQESTLLGQPGT